MTINKRNLWKFLGGAVGRIIILAIVILFIFNIGRSIYENHQINRQIDDLKFQIVLLEEQKISLQNRFLYYQTDTYKELELMRHLGYKKPGEHVAILYNSQNNNQQISSEPESQKTETVQKQEKLESIPNWQKWWEFIFS